MALPPDATTRQGAATPKTLTALAVGVFLVFWVPVLLPGRVLATRDVHFLHLPLRAALATGLAAGGPEWNPLVHGGQPLLSNPQVAAFYPPGWLALARPLDRTLGWVAVLHAALGAWGAWRLLRRLGAAPGPAVFGTIAFAAGGSTLSLLGLFNIFCGMAWAPWCLAAAHDLLVAADPSSQRRATLELALTFALATLADSATAPLLIGLLACGLAVGAQSVGWRVRLRLLASLLLAAGLAGIQLIPAAIQAADSPRASGLPSGQATVWSAPPWRALDLVLPGALGDPTRDEEGLYFGWGIHDKDYPLVTSLHPGAAVLALGLAGLLAVPIPYRRPLAAVACAGALLALGRHTPVYGLLASFPPLSLLRYPEKFVLLPLGVLAIAAALTWEAWTKRPARHDGDWPEAMPAPPPTRPGLMLAVAVASCQALLGLALAAAGRYRLPAWHRFLDAHAARPLTGDAADRAFEFFVVSGTSTAFFAAATVAVLLLLRRSVTGRRVHGLTMILVTLLAGDLWLAHHRLLATLPRELVGEPRLATAARAVLAPAAPRLFGNAAFDQRPEVGLPLGPVGFQQYLGRLSRLDPRSPGLWGLRGAFEPDFDLSLTGWARHADDQLRRAWQTSGDPEHPELPSAPAQRVLGAWGVGQMVLRNGPEELRAMLVAGQRPAYARLAPNPEALPWVRAVASWTAHPSVADAVTAVARGGYAVDGEHVVEAGGAGVRRCATASLDLVEDRGGTIRIAVSVLPTAGAASDDPLCLVVATTYHEHWRVHLDGAPAVRPVPTALGYLAMRVPPSAQWLELRYRDPWLRVGGAVTAITVLGLLGSAARARRRATAGTA